MIGISFIDFILVACNFLEFDLCKILNGYVNFSINIFSLKMAIVSVEILENCRWFKFNLDYIELLYFIKDTDYLQN